jgi:ATP-dependent Clp protease ATP-binding subunit ClpB
MGELIEKYSVARPIGAQPLKRAVQQRMEYPLSKLLLEGKFTPKDAIAVNVDPLRAPGSFGFEKAAGVRVPV